MLVPIFFACDEKFVKFTMVAIRSIIANASAENTYKIHILHMGISEPTQKKATDMATENVDIEFVDVTENMNKIRAKLPIRDYYTATTYYRLFIPEMYPEYRKALYIDSDTVALKDVAELYAVSLGKTYAGVCPDRVVAQTDILGDYTEKVLGVSRSSYFNAGIMLMNCKQFRENHLLDEFIELL